jgi:holo-[acyl-carrier protein] synthase
VTTKGVGIDVVDVARFTRALQRHPRLANRLFTESEQRDANSRPERLAARFAAKEAVLKTFKVGAGATTWKSIEVVSDESGAPNVVLHGTANDLAVSAGVGTLHLSMTHTATTAAAFVVGSSTPLDPGAS